MTEADVDAYELQQAYGEHEGAKLVIDCFARYQNQVREIKVDRLWLKMGGKSALPRSMIVRELKRLEELGLGIYTKGAHGHPSRFAFNRGIWPRRIYALATGQEDRVEEFADFVDDDMGEHGELLVHELHLRPDYDVSLVLPQDFTAEEARRIATWVKSLPFSLE